MKTKCPRSFPLFWVFLISVLGLSLSGGCSTPDSQKRLDTVLCWLRPSCLPSHPPSPTTRNPPVPPGTSSAPPKPAPVQKIASRPTLSIPCLTSAKATIQASKPFVTISYVEPTTDAKGNPLKNLAKTTIYQDVGKGMVKYKDIPATRPEGGGKIKEEMSFEMGTGEIIQATICVTATNTRGQEG